MTTATFQPKFEKLIEDIRSKIASGELQPGDQLPSNRELMETYQISSNTIRSAMLVLRSEGLICSRNGLGVYIAEDSR